jgi:hypothetical protein
LSDPVPPGPKPEPTPDPGTAKPAAPADSPSAGSLALELARTYAGREVVAIALVVLVGAFALSVVGFRDGTGVAAAMGAITTLIGTLVGSYFGFQAGSEGRNQSAVAADAANKAAVVAATFVPEAALPEFLPRLDQITGTSPSDRDLSAPPAGAKATVPPGRPRTRAARRRPPG